MRIRIRARQVWGGDGYAPVWRWMVTLVDHTDGGGACDPECNDEDHGHIIYVGEFSDWAEALRCGILAWRFANVRFRVVGGAGATSSVEVVSL